MQAQHRPGQLRSHHPVLWIVIATALISACTTTKEKRYQVSKPITQPPSTTEKELPAAPEIKPAPRINRSVWSVLRRQFELPLPKKSRVAPYLDAYKAKGWAVEVLLKRSEPYIAWIAQEAEKAGIPAEIALLPAVESGFDPRAKSGGDAVGLWQFIPATGRRFGLHNSGWYDARRDVVASTHAAFNYLKYLHGRMENDWLLALAAYNTGEGKVRVAQRKNLERGKPTGFWHLELPKETRDYVPRLMALRMIIEKPKRYGIDLPNISRLPAMAITNSQGRIDLAVAAHLAGLNADEFARLNPAYKRWSTPPGGPHQIVLPADRLNRFEKNISTLAQRDRLHEGRHLIARNETLGHIALRYDTTVRVLRQLNNLSSDRIRAGKKLIIPNPDGGAQILAANATKEPNARKMIHGVRQGDTLWDLARHYGVSIAQLASWNGISAKDYLRPGQKLIIWIA